MASQKTRKIGAMRDAANGLAPLTKGFDAAREMGGKVERIVSGEYPTRPVLVRAIQEADPTADMTQRGPEKLWG